MKSKYSTIIQLKKGVLEKIERELAQISQKIAFATQEQIAIDEAIYALRFPQSSNALDFKFVQDIFIVKSIEKNSKMYEIVVLMDEQDEIRNRYKAAMLDFEKMKYLETQEIEEHKHRVKKEAEKNLNEISIMLYNNKGIFQ